MRPLLARIAGALGGAAGADDAPAVRLEDVRRRLELLLAAIYGRPVPIAAAEPPRSRRSLRGLVVRPPRHLRSADPLPSTDGERVLLPPEIRARSPEEALARYRVLAMGQAERMARGTATYASGAATPLERDLYLLLEAAAVDRAIVAAAPGLAPALRAERAAALARRPPPDALTPAEREVEEAVRRVLAGDPAEPPPGVPAAATPAESLAHARGMAARMLAAGRAYRGVSAVGAWGVPSPVAAGRAGAAAAPPPPPSQPPADQQRVDAPREANEDDGPTDGPPDTASPDRAMPPDEGVSAGAEYGDATGGHMDASLGGGQAPADDPAVAPPVRMPPKTPARPDTVSYPEWSWRAGAYLERGATVREVAAEEGGSEWSDAALALHAATVRRLREKFERLRARRLRLARQRDGDDLDLAACVSALADARAGLPVDDRLYTATRPARRGLAILLLVDISGSTIEEVERGVRIVDLEKVAVLLTAEALDALGDPYAVLTFSGQGPHGVRVRKVKEFGERNGEAVRRRVDALEPEGFTRMGAAVRHATALLSRADAGHRLLLILSDGKPNDDDDYMGRYGVEDSRQAIAEARRAGLFPFCLTVDRDASAYLPRIFGSQGHEILRRPSQLPFALSRVVEHLLRS